MAFRRVDKKSGKNGADDKGRTEGKHRKPVVGVVLFLLVTGVPAAIAWLQGHEMACGWSPGWQRFAGWFGDCAAYAQKAPQVDLTGLLKPKTKSELRAEKSQFDLRRFYGAIKDGDDEELDKLYSEGWRLKPGLGCDRPELWKKDTITKFEKFSDGAIRCDAGYGPVDAPAYLLQKYWKGDTFNTYSANKCWHSVKPETISLIDEWIKIRPSEDLRSISARLLKAYAVAEKASQGELERLCKQRYGKGNASGSASIFRNSEDYDFMDSVFSFSSSCISGDSLLGIGYWDIHAARPLSDSSDYGMSDVEIAQKMCSWRTKKTGIHTKAAYMKERLVRWSR